MTLGGVPVAGSAGGCAMFRTQVLVVACTLSPMASWPVGAVTVMAAVPLCPSLVAVIVADPAPAPLTSPCRSPSPPRYCCSPTSPRSEERRVGKDWRAGGTQAHDTN